MAILDNIKSGIKNFTKNIFVDKEKKSYSIGGIENHFGLSYVGNSLSNCGEIQITMNSFYNIHKNNTTAQAYYKKISKMVGKYGFQIINNDGEVQDDIELHKNIKNILSIPNLDILKQQFFTQSFCAGQVFAIIGKENMLGEKKIKLLDSRGMSITTDEYGDPISYYYSGFIKDKSEKFTPDMVDDFIVFYNQDVPYLGESLYQGVVVDALTDAEAGKMNLYFFKNKARPDMIVMLSDELLQNKEELAEFKKQRQEKYQGSQNSYKPIISAGVKDIKTLEISNSDLQLIDLRKFIDTKIAITYGLDKRLVGYNTDNGGSRAEIDSVSQIQGNVKIREYATMFDDFITGFLQKLIFTNGEFDNLQIVSINDTFSNDFEDKKIWLDMVERGVITREEFRKEFGFSLDNLPASLSEYTIPTSQQFIK